MLFFSWESFFHFNLLWNDEGTDVKLILFEFCLQKPPERSRSEDEEEEEEDSDGDMMKVWWIS